MHSLLFPGLDLGLSSIGSGPSALLLGASGWGWSVLWHRGIGRAKV